MTFQQHLEQQVTRLRLRAVMQCCLIDLATMGFQTRADAVEEALDEAPLGDPDEVATMDAFSAMVGIFPTLVIEEAVAAWGFSEDRDFCRKVAEGM